MAEKGTPIVEGESSGPPNPLVSVISKLTQVFNFRFPPPTAAEKDVVKVKTESKGKGDAEVIQVSKAAVVRFPVAETTSGPSLKLEAEEMVQDTSPLVLWEVYAIGGYLILRWVLARWKERRADKASNEDSPQSPPPPPGADE